mmetsp:Transcript_20039/g.29298  ORF Transcript_20039/g.29298 Transcript_20039/m.29298 type:complete len:98 (+) Transcript_20039:1227-1520(+)
MMNNAFRNVARTALNSQRRSMSNTPIGDIYVKAMNADKHNNVAKKFLSDPATYPLILILGCTGAFCSGFGFWFLGTKSDVRINPTNRNKVIRDWGKQ